jgi:hypothetical protein
MCPSLTTIVCATQAYWCDKPSRLLLRFGVGLLILRMFVARCDYDSVCHASVADAHAA